MSQSLYEITGNLESLYEMYNDDPDNFSPELIEIGENEFNNKIENYVKFIKNKEAEITAIDNEIKRLQDLKKSKVNFIDRLKKNILNAMVFLKKKTVDLGIFKLTNRLSTSLNTSEFEKFLDDNIELSISIKVKSNIDSENKEKVLNLIKEQDKIFNLSSSLKPNKNYIKSKIDSFDMCTLETNNNLQIK